MDSGIGEMDQLLSRGVMDSMLLILWLIVGAVTFGALLEEFGLIGRLIDPMVRSAKSTGRLYVTDFVRAFGLNTVAGDQYIALVLPSKVFRMEFAERGLAPTNLSRLAADSGTVTSPLVQNPAPARTSPPLPSDSASVRRTAVPRRAVTYVRKR
ncbi:Na+/H+ antiporter NhaC family protein [Streptomyces sp. NPDC050988]|uniref:Na+/H+ antiporter NhaC family protein n=1 Tax=Streptomyces sp. NPDC050988 TaxID=3365637 RepID=UPI0037A3A3B5